MLCCRQQYQQKLPLPLVHICVIHTPSTLVSVAAVDKIHCIPAWCKSPPQLYQCTNVPVYHQCTNVPVYQSPAAGSCGYNSTTRSTVGCMCDSGGVLISFLLRDPAQSVFNVISVFRLVSVQPAWQLLIVGCGCGCVVRPPTLIICLAVSNTATKYALMIEATTHKAENKT